MGPERLELRATIATISQPGSPSPKPKATAKLAEAANLLLLLLLSVGGLLLIAWVMLSLIKNRWYAGAFIVRKGPARRVKSPWKESARRLETDEVRPRPPEDPPAQERPTEHHQ